MDAPLTCKLTTPELQHRKKTILAALKSRVLESTEIKEGVKLRFNGGDDMLDLLLGFIKSERLCCDFFAFTLTVTDAAGFARLELSGPPGTREFIRTELGF